MATTYPWATLTSAGLNYLFILNRYFYMFMLPFIKWNQTFPKRHIFYMAMLYSVFFACTSTKPSQSYFRESVIFHLT